jgi:NAD(P)H-quinone oxidoreductase subunit 5
MIDVAQSTGMDFTTPLLRIDAIALVMLALVAFIGAVIAVYSRTYLDGEPPARVRRYWRGLAATLACVAGVILSNNLLLTTLCWSATSLGVHVLLTHYGDRWQALLAAHKKFIASRIAEAALLTGTALMAASTGTLQIDLLGAHVAANGLDAQGQAGMVLIALAALIKCAQLPVHGWLIQVMEAPTPVSALLHAGIINLSGFVLIRLAEPLAATDAAQWLLVLVAGPSAALAAIVAMTRVSIKVALAWSTCAQMGFMLVECALGLPELALLHLVGHSLYKAHAFLAAGEAVAATRLHAWLGAARQVPLLHSAMAGVVLLAVAMGGAVLARASFGVLAVSGIAALALASWVVGSTSGWMLLRVAASAVALGLLMVGLHSLAGLLVGAPEHGAAPALAFATLAIFVALYGVQALLRHAPQGRFARRLHPWCFGGFFLDEHFTRLTFRIWPIRQGSF